MVGPEAAAAAERFALAVVYRNRRAGVGLDLRRVADVIGVNRVTLSRWERGLDAIPVARRKQLDRLYREYEQAAKRFDRWNGRAA